MMLILFPFGAGPFSRPQSDGMPGGENRLLPLGQGYGFENDPDVVKVGMGLLRGALR
jgi:hypothetical protein